MPPTDRANALIITGTNDSRKKINEYIQAELGLKGQGINYPLLNRLDTTQAQRQHSKYYEKGAVIIPERDYSNGLKRGAVYTVLDTGPGNKLTVSDGSGDTIAFSPARFSKLSVYSVEKTELAVGDGRITRNDAHLDLANGDRFKVKSVQSGEVLLENEKGRLVKIDANKPMYLGLAYASTVHSAQGLTCDKVFINMDTRSPQRPKMFITWLSPALNTKPSFTPTMRRSWIKRPAGKGSKPPRLSWNNSNAMPKSSSMIPAKKAETKPSRRRIKVMPGLKIKAMKKITMTEP